MPTLDTLVQLLSTYGYILLFIAGIVEGPIATILAGLLVTLGIFNPFLSYVTVVLADMTGDSAYYLLGRYGGTKAVMRWGSWLGITPQKLERAEVLFIKNRAKAIALSKFVHGIGFVGFIAAGILRIPYRSLFFRMLALTAAQSLFFLLLGILFGKAYVQLDQYLNYFALASLTLVLLIVGGLLMRHYRKT